MSFSKHHLVRDVDYPLCQFGAFYPCELLAKHIDSHPTC